MSVHEIEAELPDEKDLGTLVNSGKVFAQVCDICTSRGDKALNMVEVDLVDGNKIVSPVIVTTNPSDAGIYALRQDGDTVVLTRKQVQALHESLGKIVGGTYDN